ncbi:MAG: TM0996/MTH895 family glutaredoxin-like protein [Candidatus Marinimicrobia bacterium]|nr:TM0996/MTH895 family glutaredoxin-like protein [Candidatus Neomarinimicrobiota bacterium]
MSQTIKILGTGCPKCKQTAAIVEEVVKENNIDATIEKVEDIMEIMNYKIMNTPAIVINEEIKIKGRVPTKAEIKDLLLHAHDSTNDSVGNCCSDDSR